MSKKSTEKKGIQLGEPYGTAANKLKKSILFSLLIKAGENKCFHCNKEIETLRQFSIEHKTPWLDSNDPKGLFYDLDNIAFSHLSCNSKARRDAIVTHPSMTSYAKGCRCLDCKEYRRLKEVKRDSKKKTIKE